MEIEKLAVNAGLGKHEDWDVVLIAVAIKDNGERELLAMSNVIPELARVEAMAFATQATHQRINSIPEKKM